MGTLAIAELGDLCVSMANANTAIATRLGEWLTTTADPQLQQLFALAGHRHTWHAELWQMRRPTVPLQFADEPVPMRDATDDTDRRAAYVDAIKVVTDSLAEIAGRVDGVLDPATARVIALVSADLRELLALASP